MKTRLLAGLMLMMMAVVASAQTTNLTALLQQGLMEEQANQNLDAAIANYQQLAAQFDKDRQVAAMAIFRIGECYRTLGRTNEAAAQYQRILHDFSDQKSLAALSEQNLRGMGMTAQEVRQAGLLASTPALGTLSEKAAEIMQELAISKAQLETLEKTDLGDRATVAQQFFSDPALAKLLDQRTQIRIPGGPQDYLTNRAEIIKQTAAWDRNEAQIINSVNRLMSGLRIKIATDEKMWAALQEQFNQDQPPVPSVGSAPPASASDAEDKEIQRIQQVIQNSPDLINQPGPDGNTELIKAAGAGEIKVVTYLLDHGADVNQNTGKSFPLLEAVAAGNRSMVELLLSRGADVNARSGDGDALHMAALKRFQSVVEVLLAHKADVNSRDAAGRTPLAVAATARQDKIVRMLLAAGADPNLADNDGRTILNRAISADSPDVVATLLATGVAVNTADRYKRTPLSYAAQTTNTKLIKALLDVKADPNGSEVSPPLLLATKYTDTNSMELLLRAGADPNAVHGLEQMGTDRPELETEYLNHRNNMTPLWLAIYKGSLPAVELLLRFKADPNDTQNTGQSLLFNALGQPAILEAMLDAGAKMEVTSRDEQEWTPLGAAVSVNNAQAVEILLKHGANPNFHNRNGVTPLHRAAYDLADEKIFELLLTGGANPNVRTGNGRTPLDELNLRRDDTQSTPEQRAKAIILADLLRRHGALDKLPDWDRIIIRRSSTHFSQPVFFKAANDWNHFTLLEAIYEFYSGGYIPMSGPGYNNLVPPADVLRFPDLSHVTVIRPRRDSAGDSQFKVNLLNENGIDPTKDIPLEFGDVIEIPETDHPLGEPDAGLSQAQGDTITAHISGNVELIAGGQKIQLPIRPVRSASSLNAFLLREDARKILFSSSDLSRVKVTRHDSQTGKEQSWTIDCTTSPPSTTSNNSHPSDFNTRLQAIINASNQRSAPGNSASPDDLLLRNGDVIEVPEKQ